MSRGRMRVFGDKGSLQWIQEEPNDIQFTNLLGRTERIKRGAGDFSEAAKACTRTPPPQ
jgi:hypothetical protein